MVSLDFLLPLWFSFSSLSFKIASSYFISYFRFFSVSAIFSLLCIHLTSNPLRGLLELTLKLSDHGKNSYLRTWPPDFQGPVCSAAVQSYETCTAFTWSWRYKKLLKISLLLWVKANGNLTSSCYSCCAFLLFIFTFESVFWISILTFFHQSVNKLLYWRLHFHRQNVDLKWQNEINWNSASCFLFSIALY